MPTANRHAPRPHVEINPTDAARLDIGLGDRVELTSPHGRIEASTMVVDTVQPVELVILFHYGHGDEAANQHTWYARDPVSHQPQLKSSPVAIRRLRFHTEDWLLERMAELNGSIIEPFAARHYGTGEEGEPLVTTEIEAPPMAPERGRDDVGAWGAIRVGKVCPTPRYNESYPGTL